MIKLRTLLKTDTYVNFRRYIEIVIAHGNEGLGIMEATPFGWHFVTDPTTRSVITNFRNWVIDIENNIPERAHGLSQLIRELKHEQLELAWILLECAHRTAIQLKLFLAHYDKTC